MNRLHLTVCCLAALFVAVCGISSPSSNNAQNFSSTLNVGAINVHQFSSGGTGEFSVKITAVAPDSTILLGLTFGQMSGANCVPFAGFNVLSRVNAPTTLSGPIQKGSYCATVYDPGTLTQPENYTIAVSHP
jgi:hypothetical protein